MHLQCLLKFKNDLEWYADVESKMVPLVRNIDGYWHQPSTAGQEDSCMTTLLLSLLGHETK